MRTTWSFLTTRERTGASVGAAPASPTGEAMAGAVASLVTLAHCLSFSALIFHGDLAAGMAAGLWGFLAATAIASIVQAFTSTLPPVLIGPRNPAVAVMSVLAASVAGELSRRGASAAVITQHVLLALALAAALTGLVLTILGAFRLGQIVRFVPYPVIGGFLAASGWLLIAGGFKLATGQQPGLASLASLGGADLLRLAIAVGFAAGVQALRSRGSGSASLPALFVATVLVLDVALWLAGARAGWFLSGAHGARPWSPLEQSFGPIDWTVIARHATEILSIVGVSVIALLLDVSSLEVQRRASADMDQEFRVSGATHLALAPFGAFPVGVALNPSRLIDELGGQARLSGVVGGLAMALVLVLGLDIAALVPTPLLAGLVIYLGAGVLYEALARAPGQRSLTELALAVAIMLAIVQLGYLTGVVLGIVGACLLFAARYSRIDAIRRHLTRASFASPVERPAEEKALLAAEGGRIHVLWLTGFIFFGSSHRIAEEIRALAGSGADGRRRWVVLDLAGVTGIDSSAVLAFVKLVDWAETANVVLVLAGARRPPAAWLGDAAASGVRAHVKSFASRSEALEWCEEALVGEAGQRRGPDDVPVFEAWLAGELGEAPSRRLLADVLERRALAAGEVLCTQGSASDSIDFVATGTVVVTFEDATGRPHRMRRMAGRTIVGEMGFFRQAARTASVIADAETVVFTLHRARYEMLLAKDPALAQALLELIVRTLADRVEHANREIAALV